MCGLAMAIDLRDRGRARPWALPTMRHRGPDGEHVMALPGGAAVLEHCRLAIIDPENPEADQPFVDATGRYVLLYNGELFNFRELREDLQRRGVTLRTASDTEVVLESFLLDGEAAFRRFRGMFAIVVLDRETRRVVAARDQLGVKPLYWALSDGMFIVASELRTMLAHPSISRTLSPEGVVEYLAFGASHGPRTLVAGVHSLEPGRSLTLLGDQVSINEYWHPLELWGTPTNGGSGEALRLLDLAVGDATVSDVPVSLMLSGGLDSSTIAVLAARHVDPRLLTSYSVSFDRHDDESAVAARLAEDLGMGHREIRLTADSLAEGFDTWLDDLDVPCANPTWVAVSAIARAVESDGHKVLLSGDGGDELFGGYNRWMTYLRVHDRLWRTTPQVMRRVLGRAAARSMGGLGGDIARRAGAGGELFVGSRPMHDRELAEVLGPRGRAALARSHPEDYVESLRRGYSARAADRDYLRWMGYASLRTHLVEDYLARLDKMGMAHSVEGRVPLLDPRLVQWAFAQRQSVLIDGYRPKGLFRDSVARLLPDYILDRPKQGFCPPVAAWAQPLLADRMRDSSKRVLETSELLDAGAVPRVLADRSTNGAFAAWTLGTLIAWADRNL